MQATNRVAPASRESPNHCVRDHKYLAAVLEDGQAALFVTGYLHHFSGQRRWFSYAAFKAYVLGFEKIASCEHSLAALWAIS